MGTKDEEIPHQRRDRTDRQPSDEAPSDTRTNVPVGTEQEQRREQQGTGGEGEGSVASPEPVEGEDI